MNWLSDTLAKIKSSSGFLFIVINGIYRQITE